MIQCDLADCTVIFCLVVHMLCKTSVAWTLNLRRKILFHLEIQMLSKEAISVFSCLSGGLFHNASVPSGVLLRNHTLFCTLKQSESVWARTYTYQLYFCCVLYT